MKDQRPNILWLCSDQQRSDTIHALGNDYIDTPNLDRLCASGVAFTNAYAQNPVCTPSRASFLTGKYPSAINSNILGGENNPEHCTLITRALADAGYHCGNIGKLHISAAWYGHENRCDDGYAEFMYSLGPGHDLHSGCNEYADWLRAQGVDLDDIFTTEGGRNYSWYREDAPIELRQTAWCAERAIDFIRRNQERPWMLSVNCFDPHPPYDAPRSLVDKYLARGIPDPTFSPEDVERFERLRDVLHQSRELHPPCDDVREKRASYYGMCGIVDTHFGRIVDALDELGLRENTVIIYTSDHGEMLGDHGLLLKGCRFYDGAVRVPLIFSCPSRLFRGKHLDSITELTDIAPTIAELCGIDFPDTHGRSLLPAMCDCGREFEPREFVRSEYCNSNRGSKHTKPTYATMYRTQRYKLVVYHTVDSGELYDMEADPDEQHDLWNDPEYRELRFELMKRSFDTSVMLSRPGQRRVGRY